MRERRPDIDCKTIATIITKTFIMRPRVYYRVFSNTEAATESVLQENIFLEISQDSQENKFARVSFY